MFSEESLSSNCFWNSSYRIQRCSIGDKCILVCDSLVYLFLDRATLRVVNKRHPSPPWQSPATGGATQCVTMCGSVWQWGHTICDRGHTCLIKNDSRATHARGQMSRSVLSGCKARSPHLSSARWELAMRFPVPAVRFCVPAMRCKYILSSGHVYYVKSPSY